VSPVHVHVQVQPPHHPSPSAITPSPSDFTPLCPPSPPAPRFRHAVYLTRDGRISMAGVNEANAATIAAAIVAVAG
jgi:hypothetical protein